mmetsp:Transcript_64322/g.203324  ORF Transcript_64322/g.203324 Transcript_64322/m.203324 type:complete len:357 (-) Transcript_64322:99-1169(-)
MARSSECRKLLDELLANRCPALTVGGCHRRKNLCQLCQLVRRKLAALLRCSPEAFDPCVDHLRQHLPGGQLWVLGNCLSQKQQLCLGQLPSPCYGLSSCCLQHGPADRNVAHCQDDLNQLRHRQGLQLRGDHLRCAVEEFDRALAVRTGLRLGHGKQQLRDGVHGPRLQGGCGGLRRGAQQALGHRRGLCGGDDHLQERIRRQRCKRMRGLPAGPRGIRPHLLTLHALLAQRRHQGHHDGQRRRLAERVEALQVQAAQAVGPDLLGHEATQLLQGPAPALDDAGVGLPVGKLHNLRVEEEQPAGRRPVLPERRGHRLQQLRLGARVVAAGWRLSERPQHRLDGVQRQGPDVIGGGP